MLLITRLIGGIKRWCNKSSEGDKNRSVPSCQVPQWRGSSIWARFGSDICLQAGNIDAPAGPSQEQTLLVLGPTHAPASEHRARLFLPIDYARPTRPPPSPWITGR